MNPLKRLAGGILRFFEHKKNHAFHVTLDDQLYYVCARCSGLYGSIVVSLPLVLILHLLVPPLFFTDALVTDIFCLCLALPTLLDWTTQRLALRESTNRTRFFTAVLAGFSLEWYLLSFVNMIHKILFLAVIFGFILAFSSIDRRPQPPEPAEQEDEDLEPSG
jgi:uncharacterized membrane protein